MLRTEESQDLLAVLYSVLFSTKQKKLEATSNCNSFNQAILVKRPVLSIHLARQPLWPSPGGHIDAYKARVFYTTVEV